MILPNRIATYSGVLVGIVGAVIPVVVDMDTTSVAGWIAGIGAAITAIAVWLQGWQKHEARQALVTVADDPAFPVVPDEAQSPDVAVPGAA